jgi:hypothetical protein
MVTYGKGGWTYETVYNLPIYLRNFYVKELADVLKKEVEAKTTKPKRNRKPRNSDA